MFAAGTTTNFYGNANIEKWAIPMKTVSEAMVLLNWLWKYVSYNDSIRMITYATKPKEVRDRLKREQTTHLGTDLLENEED